VQFPYLIKTFDITTSSHVQFAVRLNLYYNSLNISIYPSVRAFHVLLLHENKKYQKSKNKLCIFVL